MYADAEASLKLIILTTMEEKQDGVAVNTFKFELLLLRTEPSPNPFRPILLTKPIYRLNYLATKTLSKDCFDSRAFRIIEFIFREIISKGISLDDFFPSDGRFL